MRVTYSTPQVDLDALRKSIKGADGFESRADGFGLRCALRTPDILGAHAHFSASFVSDAKGWAIDFEIVRGANCGGDSKRLDVGPFFEKGTKALQIDKLTSGLLSCHYSLPLDKWTPPVPLPFSSPMTFGNIPGKATVAGFDFSFPESDGYGLRRLFVTTYESSNRLAMRLLLSYPPIWGGELPNEMVRASTSLRDQLVSRRK